MFPSPFAARRSVRDQVSEDFEDKPGDDMKVFVAGASGAIGPAVVRQLVAAGHDVTAMTRTPGKTAGLQKLGASTVVADAMDAGAVKDAVAAARPEAVIDVLTAIPKRGPLRYRGLGATNAIRTRGTANLVAACLAAGCRRLVAESIVFIYGFGDLGDEAITEERPPASTAPDPRLLPPIDAVRAHEERVLGAADAGPLESIVVRFGAFYGLGAGTEVMVRMLRLRAPLLLGGGNGLTPWMYVENGASAVVAALERGRSGEVYNAVDDEPASLRDFLVELARATGAPKPIASPHWLARLAAPYLTHVMLSRLRVSSAKAKHELGWAPSFPTYREGLAAVADELRRAGAS